MSFNEMNTIENALRDRLAGRNVATHPGGMAEKMGEYLAGKDNTDIK